MARHARLVALVLAVLGVPGAALACPLYCEKSVNANEITGATTLTYQVKVACPWTGGNDVLSGISDSFEGSILPAGFFADQLQGANVYEGSPRLVGYEIPLDYDLCRALALDGQPFATLLEDGTVLLKNTVTLRATYLMTESGPWTSSCDQTVVCRPPSDGTGATRTIGFYKNHLTALTACLAGDVVDLGFTRVTTVGQALGILWAVPSRYSGLASARLLLGRQLLAAQCNVENFGAEPGGFTVAGAIETLRDCDADAMLRLAIKVDAFNNAGDLVAMPTGFEEPGLSKTAALKLATDPGLTSTCP